MEGLFKMAKSSTAYFIMGLVFVKGIVDAFVSPDWISWGTVEWLAAMFAGKEAAGKMLPPIMDFLKTKVKK